MADNCCQYNVAGVHINDTATGTDRLVLADDGVTGLDGAPVRSQVDPKGLADGGIVHPKHLAARVIVFKGFVHVRTVSDPTNKTAYLTAMNTYEAAVVSALEGILNTPTPLTWTPTGLSGRSITVTYGVPGQEIEFSGEMMPGDRTFSFALIAEDPAIT